MAGPADLGGATGESTVAADVRRGISTYGDLGNNFRSATEGACNSVIRTRPPFSKSPRRIN